MTRALIPPAYPFLLESRIEQDAESLLGEYARDHAPITEPPMPVEEIVEAQLKLTVEMYDLRAHFGRDDVLGAIWPQAKLVRIDETLDPHENPHCLGRFRFTVAHEAAHWRLHRQYFREDPTQSHLFGGLGAPAFVCRDGATAREEWQANSFAGYLLMPRRFVLLAWQEWRGSLDAVALDTLPPAGAVGLRDPVDVRLEGFCKPLAVRFQVSPQAMCIRLEKLGLLVRDPQPTLFK